MKYEKPRGIRHYEEMRDRLNSSNEFEEPKELEEEYEEVEENDN